MPESRPADVDDLRCREAHRDGRSACRLGDRISDIRTTILDPGTPEHQMWILGWKREASGWYYQAAHTIKIEDLRHDTEGDTGRG